MGGGEGTTLMDSYLTGENESIVLRRPPSSSPNRGIWLMNELSFGIYVCMYVCMYEGGSGT